MVARLSISLMEASRNLSTTDRHMASQGTSVQTSRSSSHSRPRTCPPWSAHTLPYSSTTTNEDWRRDQLIDDLGAKKLTQADKNYPVLLRFDHTPVFGRDEASGCIVSVLQTRKLLPFRLCSLTRRPVDVVVQQPSPQVLTVRRPNFPIEAASMRYEGPEPSYT